MENFEKFIKESLEQYPVEYNPEHWKRIEQQLDQSSNRNWYYLSGILAVAVISATVYFTQGEPAPSQTVTASREITAEPKAAVTPAANKEIAPEKPAVTHEVPAEPMMHDTQQPSADNTSHNTTSLQTPEPPVQPEVKPAPLSKKPQRKNEMSIAINVNRSQGCASEPFYFTADVNVPATYQWNFGDGSTSNLPNPSHAYSQPGRYSVALKVTSLLDGSTLRTSDGGTVIVNPKPIARFSWDVNDDNNFSRKVELSNQSRNITYNQWIVDGKSYLDDNPVIKFNRRGNYKVSLIVKNEVGCYDTISQNISLDKDYNLLAPNAFTPNDDNQNDDFLPAALRNTNDVDFRMEIIDPKTGNVVYSTNKRPWSGFNQATGQKAEEGTYLWIITLMKSDNTKEIFKGNVSLLR